MNYRFELSQEINLLRGYFNGVLSDDSLTDFIAALERAVVSHSPKAVIVDWSRTTGVTLTAEGIRNLANSPTTMPPCLARVHVVPKDVAYGMARMFQIIGAHTRPNFHVVRTLQEAQNLLSPLTVYAHDAATSM